MKKQAFTLIELLLALVLFSIIGLALYSVFASGIKVSKMSNDDVAVYREARWALEIIARDLENMTAYHTSKDEDVSSGFLAQENAITFILRTPQGLKQVKYYLENPQSATVHKTLIGNTYAKNVDVVFEQTHYQQVNYLLREENALVSAFNEEEGESFEREMIASNIKPEGLRFSFGYQKGEENVSYEWKKDWEQEGVPANVRVELDFLIMDEKEQKTLEVYKDVFIPHGVYGAENI